MKTRQTYLKTLLTPLLVVTLLGLSGCGGKKVKPEGEENTGSTPAASEENTNGDANTLGDSDSGRAQGLQTVHFAFDSSVLDSTAKSEIKANAKILKEKPSIKIQIEGHCDQRGGIQYNIALGERRAKAVKHYLTDQGISPNRVTVISYGKERPIDRAENEEAYAKNRRANFVITSK